MQSQNLAVADIWGIEAAAVFKFRDDLVLNAIINFAHGREEEANSSTVSADRIPTLNGRVGLRYVPNESFTIEPFIVFADSQPRLSPGPIFGTCASIPTGLQAG